LTCDADGPCNHPGGRATRCAPLVTCDDGDAGAELVTPWAIPTRLIYHQKLVYDH